MFGNELSHNESSSRTTLREFTMIHVEKKCQNSKKNEGVRNTDIKPVSPPMKLQDDLRMWNSSRTGG